MERVVVVTGGASGIGRCLVESFANKGDIVYFIDNNEKELNEFMSRMRDGSLNVTGYHGDIASEQVLRDFADLILSHYPDGIHCLINNACLSKKGIISGCSYDDFMYTMRVGVAAPYLLALLFKDHFCGLGSIVNISSTRAFQSQPDTESYSAAKGGITALTHALAVSLAGVARVNSVAPGWIDTAAFHNGGEHYVPSYSVGDVIQHPSGRVGDPSDVVRVVDFLCDERNSFINGENITVDGGMSHLMIYHDDYGWKINS